MAKNEQLGDLQALADAVKARREQRGWRQSQVIERSGLGESTVTRIEAVRRPESAIARSSLEKLDDGLEWPRGHSRAIYLGLPLPVAQQGSEGNSDPGSESCATPSADASPPPSGDGGESSDSETGRGVMPDERSKLERGQSEIKSDLGAIKELLVEIRDALTRS